MNTIVPMYSALPMSIDHFDGKCKKDVTPVR